MSEKKYTELEDSMPTLEEEKGRDKWMKFLMSVDLDKEFARAIIIHDEAGHMVLRVRYDNGREEIMDLQILRMKELAASYEERESN